MSKELKINCQTSEVVERELTTEEENTRATEHLASRTAHETARQAKETAQANGNQKLLDLGLTQAEATALTGYTPPVAE